MGSNRLRRGRHAFALLLLQGLPIPPPTYRRVRRRNRNRYLYHRDARGHLVKGNAHDRRSQADNPHGYELPDPGDESPGSVR